MMAALCATGCVGAASAAGPATATAADAAAAGATPPIAPADSAPFDPATDEGALTVLGLTLNGTELAGDTIVTVRNGETLIPLDDITRLRVRHEGGKTVVIDGQAFMALSAVPGLAFKVDKPSQQLLLTVPIDSFIATTISNAREYLPPSEAARTAFLDYDLSFQHAGGKAIGTAFLQSGVSDDRGLLTNTMTLSSASNAHHVVRLDTSFIRDAPSGLVRLTVGDTVTRGSSWSPQVRFGGIKYGTDFSLQPGFLSFPTPTFDGRAALPSNIELYVNNVLNYQGQVNQGPFALDRLPLVTGAGDVSLIVKDALGVEHRIVSNYYVSSALLRPGLSDYSLEAGAERRRYGFDSFHYGGPFAAATYRHGLSAGLTLETRAEAGSDVQNAGAGAVLLLGKIAEVGGSVAASHGPDGLGTLYRIYLQRISSGWSLSLNYQATSHDFAQIGLVDRADRPRRQLQATGGINFGKLGNIALATSYLRLGDGTRTRISSFTYNRSLGTLAYLSAFLLRSDTSGSVRQDTIGASLSIPLGARRTGYVQVDNNSRRAEIQRTLPDDKGWGYRLVASQGATEQQEADLDFRGRTIELSGQVARFNGTTSERVLASGAFILAGGSVMPTRRLNNSFAIVDVGGEKGVRVLQENRDVAVTNGAGLAIVTNLRPYEANRLAVAPDDFKLDATIPSDSIIVVPRFLSGVTARFHVGQGHAGTVIILLPDGNPLEPGTTISYDNGEGAFFTGFDGETFIDDISAGKVLVAKRAVGACIVQLPVVQKGVVLPRIGPLTCRPVEPAKK